MYLPQQPTKNIKNFREVVLNLKRLKVTFAQKEPLNLRRAHTKILNLSIPTQEFNFELPTFAKVLLIWRENLTSRLKKNNLMKNQNPMPQPIGKK